MRKMLLFAFTALVCGAMAASEGEPPHGPENPPAPGGGGAKVGGAKALVHPVCPIYSYATFSNDYCSYYSIDCINKTYVSMSRDCKTPNPNCESAADPPCIDLGARIKGKGRPGHHVSKGLKDGGIRTKLNIQNPVPTGARAQQLQRIEGFLQYDSQHHTVPVVLHIIQATPGNDMNGDPLPSLIFGNGYEKSSNPSNAQFTILYDDIIEGQGTKAVMAYHGSLNFLIVLNSEVVEAFKAQKDNKAANGTEKKK